MASWRVSIKWLLLLWITVWWGEWGLVLGCFCLFCIHACLDFWLWIYHTDFWHFYIHAFSNEDLHPLSLIFYYTKPFSDCKSASFLVLAVIMSAMTVPYDTTGFLLTFHHMLDENAAFVLYHNFHSVYLSPINWSDEYIEMLKMNAIFSRKVSIYKFINEGLLHWC